VLACIFSAALLALGYREKRLRWIVASVLVTGVLIAASASCGGGSGGGGGGNPGTPTGTTNPVVNVTINGVTQSVGVTLNVQ